MDWRTPKKDEGGGSSSNYKPRPQGGQDRQQNSSEESTATLEGRRLYVGNLPYKAKRGDVEQVFVDRGFVVEKLIMSTDPFTGLNPSYCFIELNTKAEADRAKEEITGNATIYGRPLKVNNVVPKKDMRVGTIKSYDNGTPRQRTETYNNYEKPFAVNRWEKGRESNSSQDACKEGRRLYVGGLPQINGQGLLDKKIHEIFIKYKIEAVSRIVSPVDSKRSMPGSHYFCFVDIENADEARAAVLELNNTATEWGGFLQVSIAKTTTRGRVGRGAGGLIGEPEKPLEPRQLPNNWRAR